GIQLKTEIQRRDIFVRPEILTFAQNFNNTQAMQRALKQAQADVLYKETIEAFNKGDFELCLNKFYKAIHMRYDIEKPNSIRFIRRKLNTINSLKAENKRLREELSQRNQHLNKYALEYVQLGNDCITQAHNAKAAIKNYNKALKLNPNCIDALVRKGITLMNTGNTAEAEQELNKAVELSPISFMALYNRGKLNMQLERYELAVADFDKCVSIKPKHANAHQLFGNALNELGNEEAAQIQWAIANELRKKN
ncbi:MAG: tetratricopeptide repeat protein, partial [Bacteroidaceae bacterium]|nr:tetratricopeptide repeat protein [Bacteroidaceae bacterium]